MTPDQATFRCSEFRLLAAAVRLIVLPLFDPKPCVAAGRLREAQFTAIVAAAIASRLSHSIRFASASADAGYQPFGIE